MKENSFSVYYLSIKNALTDISRSQSQSVNYIDSMKLIASFTVVLVHSAAARLIRYGELADSEWMVANIFNSFGRYPVPLFLLISGLVFIGRKQEMDVGMFYQKRCKKILLPMLFWCAFHFFWISYYYGWDVNAELIIEKIYSGMIYTHYYFLFVILGLYLATPILDKLYRSNVLVYLGLLLVVMLFNFSGLTYSLLEFNAFTFFIPFLMYYMLGALIRNIELSSIHALIVLVVYFLISAFVCWGTLHQFQTYPEGDFRLEYYVDNLHFPIFLQSLSVFLLIKYVVGMASENTLGFIKKLAPATFGVYLIHVAVLDVVRASLGLYDLSGLLVDIVVESVIAFGASMAIILLLLKIPFIRRVIF